MRRREDRTAVDSLDQAIERMQLLIDDFDDNIANRDDTPWELRLRKLVRRDRQHYGKFKEIV